jgi:hypothetical protein
MSGKRVEAEFQAIWHRCMNSQNGIRISPETISSWALDKGISAEKIEECQIGRHSQTKGILVVTKDGNGFFPEKPFEQDNDWTKRNSQAEADASLLEKMEWFFPLWVSWRNIQNLLQETRNCSQQRAVELFNYHTSTIYTLSFQAVCIEQIMMDSRILSQFNPIVREAFLAFYSGHRASSISALIPIIEGSLNRILPTGDENKPIANRVDAFIDHAIDLAAINYFDNAWAPKEYMGVKYLFCKDERILVFETFRRWLINSFYRKTSEYNGATWLNRHLFAHGASSSWQQSANFVRLIVALTTLGAIHSWCEKSGSLFFPEINEDSKLLWEQAIINANSQMMVKSITEQRYHENGKLTLILPTDDGVLLRKSILTQDCIDDLVRPLRNSGWNVSVGEPDSKALHVSVIATSGEKKITIALLYSCATDSEIYKELAEKSDAILYRGAPYHQESFARGIKIHVGPVAGWQPPDAKSLA